MNLLHVSHPQNWHIAFDTIAEELVTREVDHIIYDAGDELVINLGYVVQVTQTTGPSHDELSCGPFWSNVTHLIAQQ